MHDQAEWHPDCDPCLTALSALTIEPDVTLEPANVSPYIRTYSAYLEKSSSDTEYISISATPRDNTASIVQMVDGESVTGELVIAWAGTSNLSKVITFTFTKGSESTTYTIFLVGVYTGS